MLCYLIYVKNMKIHFITSYVPNYSTRTSFSGQRVRVYFTEIPEEKHL